MSKTIIVAGYGPGISHAVAERFGAAGFSLALVARDAAKLGKGAEALKAKGFKAQAFPADLSDVAAVRGVIKAAREAFGPITALHWNAAAFVGGDLLSATPEDLMTVFNVAVVGLVTGVQDALADLKQQKGAVLVTNGGFGLFADAIDAFAVQAKAMSTAIGNSAKHKLSRVLAKRLEVEGVYLGEVMVTGVIKGTAWDSGGPSIEPKTVADRFWQLYEGRKERFVQVG